MSKKKLTASERAFVAAFVVNDNAAESYRSTHSVKNLTEIAVASRAYRVVKRQHVADAIEVARKKVGDTFLFDAKDVLMEWLDIATADPNELTSYQRRCCRHCYGKNHNYQWRDAEEYAGEIASVIDNNASKKGKNAKPLPDAAGGYGFNFALRPHPDCTHCRGEGIGTMFVHDTTKLSRKARKLFGGVQQTAQGLKIVMRDQDEALANYAKALGMFVDKMELTGKDGAPLSVPLPTDPIEAAKIYQQLIKGN